MARQVFHVVPDGDGWKVEVGGSTMSRHDTQEQAVQVARDEAQSAKPSQMVVHGRGGEIEDEATYEADPFPPRG